MLICLLNMVRVRIPSHVKCLFKTSAFVKMGCLSFLVDLTGILTHCRSAPFEGIGYQLQYSCASWVVQTIKNPPAMWETRVRSLVWEDPLEEGMAAHSSILAWRTPWTEEPGGLQRVSRD